MCVSKFGPPVEHAFVQIDNETINKKRMNIERESNRANRDR